MARKSRRTQKLPHKVMLINAREPYEVRVAVLVENSLEEFYIERPDAARITGNIYKGVVVNVEKTLQAAFVRIGTEKNAFLHASDVVPPDGGFPDILKKPRRSKSAQKHPDRKLAIEEMLRPKQEVLVQVAREGLGNKGPSVTTYISLPGKYLVLMPALKRVGVSKKITDEKLRRKLRERLNKLALPKDVGIIIRTAAADVSDAALRRDLAYLKRLWKSIRTKTKNTPAPAVIHEEQSLVLRALRETLTTDTGEVIVDSETAFDQARDFVKQVSPSMEARIKLYSEPEPLMSRYGVERQVEALFDRKVPLPSGGSIVIEQTEAMVAVDVNSGKNREHSSSEDMILDTNLEAARELARQLRLRDIGGLVLVDFIDMEKQENRRLLMKTLREQFKKDRARFSIAPISPFGVVEMTRQRTGRGLQNVIFSRCPHCAGTGFVRSGETLALAALRALQEAAYRNKGQKVLRLHMHPSEAPSFSNDFRHPLAALETNSGVRIIVAPDPDVSAGKIRVVAETDGKELFSLER